MRKEKDKIGTVELSADIPYGINTYRALNNFLQSGERIQKELIIAYLQVKKAAANMNFKCGNLSAEKYRMIDEAIDNLIIETSAEGDLIYRKIVVDPYQGGAGTSLNMNINEVIANTALKNNGFDFGEYSVLHPLNDINKSQSTNDTFVTAGKIASLKLLKKLQDSFAYLQNALQKKEKEFSNILKLGRTQLQDAVPVTLGAEFAAYAQAVARDRWRLYNAEERLRSVNLGGTAIGTSVSASNKYVLGVVNELREITRLPIAKAEDLIEATQNMDVFVEVHGIVKAGATSLIKICNDLRLLSSGPNGGIGEISLPQVQAGSTIMPGKVNPVILENTIQICELVKGNDAVIANLVSMGNLELNQFAPMIVHLFLKSHDLLRAVIINLSDKCIAGITVNKEKCKENLINSTAIAATFITKYGYDKVTEVVKLSEQKGIRFIEVLKKTFELSDEEVWEILGNDFGLKDEDNS